MPPVDVLSVAVRLRTESVAALAAALVLALCACSGSPGDDGDAAAGPSPSATSPTSPAIGAPLGPELPDEADVRRALVDYYAAVNRAVTNRALTELDAVSTPECVCRDRYEQVIERMTERGVRASGFFFTGVATGDVTVDGATATLAAIDTTEDYEIVDPSGAVVAEVGPDQVVVQYTFTLVDDDWLVSGSEEIS